MSDFEHPLAESAFPRPTSLYQPERFTPSLLDSSSYSPFPSVAGSRSDPFGLNAYLLHPGDQLWAYMAPAGAEPLSSEKELSPPPAKSRMGGLKKIKSSAALRKGSPLSQPSTMAVPERTLGRKRSQSMDSTSSATTSAAERDEVVQAQKSGTAGKKGLSRLFGRRKSVSALPVIEGLPLPPVPPLPTFNASGSSSDLSTPPQSNRSSLMISDRGSTVSASSSSDALPLRTPQDSPSGSPSDFGDALAKADVEDGSLKKRGLMGWLGRRTLKMPSSAPSSTDSSPSVSPNSSSTNLAQPTLSATSADPPSRINPTPEQQPYAWVGDQLRRASYRKLAQLRRPSPHPLAQQLRRQTSHLPNEVASSFEVGQIIYPRSINPRDPSAGLTPAQRGLWCLLGVKLVLDALERGALPSGGMGKRPSLPHTLSDRKARGMRDFINRPPFEDRHIVYYPDNNWSPVSMARPGFGVWDLDFSKYILALADSGEMEQPAWPVLPRPSLLGMEGLRSDPDEVDVAVVDLTEEVAMGGVPKAASFNSDSSDDTVSTMMINTPPVLEMGHTIPEIKIDFHAVDVAPLVYRERQEQAESSFRPRSKVVQATWEDSDEEEEDDEDVQPLAQAVRPPRSGMQASTSDPTVQNTSKGHTRQSSQPTLPSQPPAPGKLTKRRSQFDMAMYDEKRQSRAMDEVAKARERRQALSSGEVDRRAEGENRRKEEAKRRSVAVTTAPIRSQSTGGATGKRASVQLPPGEESRQRTKSFVHTTTGSPVDQTRPQSMAQTKRYHSFYELPTNPSSSNTRGASHPSPAQYSQHPGMVHSASMGFSPQMMSPNMGMGMYYPQPIPQMYFPAPPMGMPYGYAAPPQHPGMGMSPSASFVRPSMPAAGMPNSTSRSSLSLSEQQQQQQRRQRQRSSYA
ncbi:uncharacterized protein MKK02DRAFT_43199 [Dioszegia hungarica]|uniref:Uncharacterized protein n=1 Tax=Dioszegia hungarica TaxID=4972 RepID=A0AA38LXG3_9TREE|nr:uncharacterized protein MKK02DRAFT_43199 [Dioszegia hungarica]KAI9637276.1 hypothetical protein MKK02DRAFT_43199 [Dioszegia hungarica]